MELQQAEVRKDLGEQIRGFQRELFFRVLIGASTLLFCLLLHYSGVVKLPILALSAVSVFVIFANIPYYYLLKRAKNPFPLVTFFCIVDALVITSIIHLTGGVNASILVLGYPLIIIYAGITLPTYSPYVLAISSVVFYSGLLLVEKATHFSMAGATDAFSTPYIMGRMSTYILHVDN